MIFSSPIKDGSPPPPPPGEKTIISTMREEESDEAERGFSKLLGQIMVARLPINGLTLVKVRVVLIICRRLWLNSCI